jgi:hypothetical protein
VPAGGVQVAAGLGPLGQGGQGFGEVGDVVALALGGLGVFEVVPGLVEVIIVGQDELAEEAFAPGQGAVPVVVVARGLVVLGQEPGRPAAAGAGQPLGPPDAAVGVQVVAARIVGELELIGDQEVLLGPGGVAGQARGPGQAGVRVADLAIVQAAFGPVQRLGGDLLRWAGQALPPQALGQVPQPGGQVGGVPVPRSCSSAADK